MDRTSAVVKAEITSRIAPDKLDEAPPKLYPGV